MRHSVRTIAVIGAAVAMVTAGTTAYAAGGNGTAPGANVPGAPGPGVANAAVTNAAPIVPTQTQDSYADVRPCLVASIKLHKNSTRTLAVSQVASYATQGGNGAGCGLPDDTHSVVLSLSSVAKKAVKKAKKTNAASIYVSAGAPSSPSVPALYRPRNLRAVGSYTTAVDANGRIAVRNTGKAGSLQVEVVGYYAPPIQADITSQGDIYSGGSGIASVSHPATGFYEVTLDRDLPGCAPMASMAGGHYYVSAYYIDAHTIGVSTWQITGGNPGALDLFFYLTVVC